MSHECKKHFLTRKIDECSGEGYNRCFGFGPMVLEVWFADKDGTESYYDEWIQVKVDFCPFCGLKSKEDLH
jgi:hypothetical protein